MDYKKMAEERNSVNRFPVSNGITVVEISEGYASLYIGRRRRKCGCGLLR